MLSEVCLAAAKRSESELRQLIASGHDVNAGFLVHHSDAPLLAPLCFALNWPAGLQILLEAGANPSVISTGDVLHEADASAMSLLLAHGYPLFSTDSYNVLQGKVYSKRWSGNVLNAMIERLVQDRRQLLALARSQLSLEDQEAFGLNALKDPSGLLDKHAKSIGDALEQRSINIPAKIWPGPQETIFHCNFLTREIVGKLFAAGFRDIDVEDAAGYTPLVLACWRMNWELVEWYLDRGADPQAIGKAGFVSLSHFVASKNQNWGFVRRDEGSMKALRRSLTKLSTTCGTRTPDDCNCYCSVAGCLPAGICIKGWIHPMNRADTLDSFISYVSPDCVEAAYLDACRVEVFERLGMVHTCCKSETAYPVEVTYGVPRRYQMPEEERLELQDEYAELNDILETYMRLYKDLRSECSGRFSLFWQAWWEAVSNDLPEDPPGRYRFDCCGRLVSEEESECHELAVGLGYEPDEEAIRTRIRDLLPVGFGVDPAEIFLDGISNLFDD